MATAGMRFLSPEDQSSIISATCDYLTSSTPFNLQGKCSDHVQIISGVEEGLLGWIAINYLMDGFQFKPDGDELAGSSKGKSTYGFLDMGGASTQIAFEPSKKALDAAAAARPAAGSEPGPGSEELTQVKLKLLDGSEVTHDVFVTTFLGFGTNKARERYEDALIHNATHATSSLSDPCLPLGATTTPQITGSGSFPTCLHSLSPLLDKSAPCLRPPCLFHGIHVPPIDFSLNHFIGVSEYWFSSHDVFGLGGAYDYVSFQRAAEEFCARPWSELEQGWKEGKFPKQVDEGRLKMQCFKAAWMVTVLHEGIGLPRVIDSKGKGDGKQHADEVGEKAGQKNLDDTGVFQSVNEVEGTAVSWTLGKAILEATKDIESVKTIDGGQPPSGRPLPPWYAPGGSIGSHLPTTSSGRASGGIAFALLIAGLVGLGLFLALTRGHSPAAARRRQALRSLVSCGRRGGRARTDGGGEYSLANMEEGADDGVGKAASASEEGTSSSGEEDAALMNGSGRGAGRRRAPAVQSRGSLIAWLPVTARRWVRSAASLVPGKSSPASRRNSKRRRSTRRKHRTSMSALDAQASLNNDDENGSAAGSADGNSVDDLVRLAHVRRAVSPALMRESRSASPSLATMPSSIVLTAPSLNGGAAISRPASRLASGRQTPIGGAAAAASGYASPPALASAHPHLRPSSPGFFHHAHAHAHHGHDGPAVAWTSASSASTGTSTPVVAAFSPGAGGNGFLQPSATSFASFSAAMRENRERAEERLRREQEAAAAKKGEHKRGSSE